MAVAHLGVGLFVLGVTVTQSYREERDIGLRPGESATLQGYRFTFEGTQPVQGANFTGLEGRVVIREGERLVAELRPQKRQYPVRQDVMTEAAMAVDWNRDLFVAMGEDLGDGAWSMRLQYKPMVRFIWLGALVMALGGLIAIGDRRYRTRRAGAAAGAAGAESAARAG
jgi:cytochrome c-type biogenesis protein CcmF